MARASGSWRRSPTAGSKDALHLSSGLFAFFFFLAGASRGAPTGEPYLTLPDEVRPLAVHLLRALIYFYQVLVE